MDPSNDHIHKKHRNHSNHTHHLIHKNHSKPHDHYQLNQSHYHLHNLSVCPAANQHERDSEQPVLSTQRDNTHSSECRILWFAGMSEGIWSKCTQNISGYTQNYAAALQSAIIHANNTIQPVLLLGRYGLENSTQLSRFGQWAKSQGAIVIVVPALSFQDEIVSHLTDPRFTIDYLIGPYLRLDIPYFVKKYRLFEMNGICPEHVIYTDSDIIFANDISHQEISMITQRISKQNTAFVMYGREQNIHNMIPDNTGVMFMDVSRFEKEWPSILQFGIEHQFNFSSFDQGWLNEYFKDTNFRVMLPLYWNWKLYWRLKPSTWLDLKVIHFHGPKPGKGLELLASGNTSMIEKGGSYLTTELILLIKHGYDCDGGITARKTLNLYHKLQPSWNSFC